MTEPRPHARARLVSGLVVSLVASLVAGLVAGCSLAPPYQRPAAPVAAAYPDAGPGREAGPGGVPARVAADTAWRDFFTEPRLRQLIAAALEHNRDLRTAALRIEEARAQYNIAAAERLPSLNASLGAARARTPALPGQGGRAGVGERFDAGLAMPAFELDYLGRVRNLNQAALALYLASDEARQAAHIGVVAETAKAYFTERALAEQYALATQTLEGRARTVELTRQRVEAGASSRLDLRQNETLYQSARVAALTLARQRAQAANALTLLVGQAPTAAPGGAAPGDAALDAMSALPAGLPSELLARRPDIRAAELRLQAANANIGAARAAFFPRLSLTAALGSASAAFSGLFDSDSGNWSFAPQLLLPLFDGGRNRANLNLGQARKNLAVADYERTIQVAFREVADALAARTYLGEQVAAQRAVREAQAERLTLLQLRFENGVASTLDVLDAQRELFNAEQSLVQARLLRATSAVDLYRALGGGLE